MEAYLRGELQTGATEAREADILARARLQMNIPPLLAPDMWICSVSTQKVERISRRTASVKAMSSWQEEKSQEFSR